MTNHLEATSRKIETSSPYEKGQVNPLSEYASNLLNESSKERQTCNPDCKIMNTSMDNSSLNSREKRLGNGLLNALEQGSQEDFNKLVSSGGSDINKVLPALNSVLEKHGMTATFSQTQQETQLTISNTSDKSVIYNYYDSVYEPGIPKRLESDFKKVQVRMSPLF